MSRQISNKRIIDLIDLGVEISRLKDVDLLLERVLSVSRQIVDAEAGSIYIREGNRLKFSHTQNVLLQKRLPPGKKLIFSTFSIPINSDSISGYVANTGELLNIPDVYHLPENVPFSFDKEYDILSDYRTKSMLALPLTTAQGNIIGVLQLINSKDGDDNIIPFNKDNEPLIRNFANIASAAIERAQLTRAIILRVIKMAEMRDPKETGPHVNRVASYAVEIYEEWAKTQGVPMKDIEKNKDILRMGAMLHDVGKVAISDTILKKPSRLTPDEFEIMKQHTYIGARLFSDIYSDMDEAASIIALNHHERWDGMGYPGHINFMTGNPLPGRETNEGKPMGKKKEEIPPFGRVVAIADVFDALISHRVYKEPWDESRVLDTLRSESGKQFDPEMIDAFFACLDVIRSIIKKYPD
ncbi:MAG: HD domain-containing protein [Nitrospirae bacterium]|nr:HD domain-containing protein [Nitrospirota bacterium]